MLDCVQIRSTESYLQAALNVTPSVAEDFEHQQQRNQSN
jgi:hypothetical protein